MNAQLATNGLWEWTWHTSLEASVLAVLVILTQSILGGLLTARARYVLGFLVVCRLSLPVAPPSGLSLFNLELFSRNQGPPSALGTGPQMEARRVSAVPSAPSQAKSAFMAALGESAELPVGTMRPSVSPPPPAANDALALLWASGVLMFLLASVWRHCRFQREINVAARSVDAGIESLLETCKQQIGVRETRRIKTVITERAGVPALFGVWRPRLLLPKWTLELEAQELRFVLLHELAHLKRRDTLLNWVMIVISAWHWFNPVVWWTLRRLRADRELVCDEMVLRVLSKNERRSYGEMLLKFLELPSAFPLTASLVPVLGTQPSIKRRIMMISRFKPPGRMAWLIPSAAAALLCVLTFSKAAEQPEASSPGEAPLLKNSPPRPAIPASRSAKAIQRLEQIVEKQRAKVAATREKVDVLRRELGGIDETAQNAATNPETLRMLEKERIAMEMEGAKRKALLDSLGSFRPDRLRQILPTAAPDTVLISMLDRLSTLQTEYAKISTEFGSGNSRATSVTSAMKDLNTQIDERIRGILEGLSAQWAASKAQSETVEKMIAQAKEHDAQLIEKYRPYFLAKGELETQQRLYETMLLRLLQEKVDAQLNQGSL